MLEIVLLIMLVQLFLKLADQLHHYAVLKCDFYNFDIDLADHIRYLWRCYNKRPAEHKATQTAF